LRFPSTIQREPIEQLLRLIAFQFQYQRSDRRFLVVGDRGDYSDVSSLSVEQDPHAISIYALQQEPSSGVPDVPVSELVVYLLQAAIT
jgi:hypothetical protein